jgi:hypothetical protein
MQDCQTITNTTLYGAYDLNSFCQSTQDYCLCLPENSGSITQVYGKFKPNMGAVDNWMERPTNFINQDRNMPMSFSQIKTDISNHFCVNNWPGDNPGTITKKSVEENVTNVKNKCYKFYSNSNMAGSILILKNMIITGFYRRWND